MTLRLQMLAVALAATAAGVSSVEAADQPSAPDGFVRVVDDTGAIAVALPEAWTEIDTAPAVVLDTAFPRITASAPGGAPSVTVGADVYVEPLDESACEYWQRDCAPHEVAGLRGMRWFGEECCAGPGRWITLRANPTDGRRVTVEVHLSDIDPAMPDPGLLDTIAASVEVLAEPFPADWVVSPTSLAPPVAAPLTSVWPYGDFHDVPQLGDEPVRGSGCGANGQIGTVIPDGLWAGYVTYVPDGDRWDVNLVCVYFGASAQDVLAGGTANIVNDDPDYLIVDNNPRTRSVPNRLTTISTSFADVRTDGRCLPGGSRVLGPDEEHLVFPPGEFESTYGPDYQAWIRIHDGAATWIHFGCDNEMWAPGG